MKKLISIFAALCFLFCSSLFAAQPVAFGSNAFSVKTTGAVALFTTYPAIFLPDKVFIFSPSVNNISVPATISIGTNSPNCNNIIPATLLTALTSGNYYSFPITNTLAIIPKSSEICANVTIAATGTSQNIRVSLSGIQQ